jgi:hypothetical protein
MSVLDSIEKFNQVPQSANKTVGYCKESPGDILAPRDFISALSVTLYAWISPARLRLKSERIGNWFLPGD